MLAITFKIVFCTVHPTGLLKLSTIVLLFPELAAVVILSNQKRKLVWCDTVLNQELERDQQLLGVRMFIIYIFPDFASILY